MTLDGMVSTLTLARLRQLISYDPATGVVIQLEDARGWRDPSKNASGFKGVRWHKAGKAWQGRIKVDGRERHLGLFDTPAEAAAAYQEAARKAFVVHQPGWLHPVRGMPGYTCVKIDGREYRLHHVIWFYQTGKWPAVEIDHINGDGLDNRWCNLREATRDENACNQRLGVRNTSGYKGVSWDKRLRKWCTQLRVDCKCVHSSYHASPERAFIAYIFAAWEHHGEFARIDADYLVARCRWFKRMAPAHAILRNLANGVVAA